MQCVQNGKCVGVRHPADIRLLATGYLSDPGTATPSPHVPGGWEQCGALGHGWALVPMVSREPEMLSL